MRGVEDGGGSHVLYVLCSVILTTPEIPLAWECLQLPQYTQGKSVAADLNPTEAALAQKIFSFVPLFFAALSLLIIRTLKPAPNHEPLLSHWALLINDLKDPALHHTGCGGSNPFICFSRSSNSFALKSHLMGFNPSYFKIMGGVKSFNPISR